VHENLCHAKSWCPRPLAGQPLGHTPCRVPRFDEHQLPGTRQDSVTTSPAAALGRFQPVAGYEKSCSRCKTGKLRRRRQLCAKKLTPVALPAFDANVSVVALPEGSDVDVDRQQPLHSRRSGVEYRVRLIAAAQTQRSRGGFAQKRSATCAVKPTELLVESDRATNQRANRARKTDTLPGSWIEMLVPGARAARGDAAARKAGERLAWWARSPCCRAPRPGCWAWVWR
jgi:hypothetical protein